MATGHDGLHSGSRHRGLQQYIIAERIVAGRVVIIVSSSVLGGCKRRHGKRG
jgi:hypothetical protein